MEHWNHIKGYVGLYQVSDNEIVIHFEDTNGCQDFYNKLLAWKRLKDKGFRLNHWKEAQLRPNMSCVAITGNMKVDEDARADLDLLFCSEEKNEI